MEENTTKVENTTEEQTEVRTYTDEDVNAIVAKKQAKATSKFVEELGFENADALKEVLTKYNEMQEATKTEAQKIAEERDALVAQLAEKESAIKTATAKTQAMALGVNPDLLDDFIILSNSKVTEDKDINTVMSEMLEKMPAFKGEASAPKIQVGTQPRGTENKLTGLEEAFYKINPKLKK